MPRWDIDTGGVRAVVTRTGAVAEHLERQAGDYGQHLESAAKSAGTLSRGGGVSEGGLVAVALAEFAEATRGRLRFVATRSGRSLAGAVDATTAYVNGDLEMAANAQREALTAPVVDAPGSGGSGGQAR
ncbi:DUF6507 family protein [Wenjunlia tyrosinilytica]|uniref:Uncharacterized protein n=1 Tax=Wenjunlia tyrosinilytica TaxID=1544741 RepID=A0A918DXK3_9ACTN|nr:DUF6507 family protein [Wenjunlia tyrosinilytica]GGO89362.1 hypothetical protein GCM10012280_32320 [Wenjunlia tyrosinilytica]